MLSRSIPKELVAVLVAAMEDLFCSEGADMVVWVDVEAAAAVLAELLAWVETAVEVVAAAPDSEYHFLSMYFIRMNSFSFTGSLLPKGSKL